MISNPFTYGNPISEPHRFVGRKQQVEQVISRLRNSAFESSSLVGERRIGKTSVLKYLKHPDVRHTYHLASDKYIFVYVDLQMVNSNTTPVRLWQRLLWLLEQDSKDADMNQLIEERRHSESIDTFDLADLFDSFDKKGKYVVFLLDEFEHVTKNQNFEPDFFYGLRSLAISKNLALITSSRHELIELCHSEAIRSSPFFNIFATIHVQLFSLAEAQQLISQLLTGTGINFSKAEIDHILRIAGCHPYFLQIGCHFLFDAYIKGFDQEARVHFMSKEFRREAFAHFNDYWRNSFEQEKIVLTALALLKLQQRKIGGRNFSQGQLQELYTRSDQTLAHLEKRGLLTNEGDSYSLFSVSFGEWICSEITDTLHDSQSYEDWLRSNKRAMEQLSQMAKGDLGAVLPKIGAQYRELVIKWASDPKNLIAVAMLLKTVLGFA